MHLGRQFRLRLPCLPCAAAAPPVHKPCRRPRLLRLIRRAHARAPRQALPCTQPGPRAGCGSPRRSRRPRHQGSSRVSPRRLHARAHAPCRPPWAWTPGVAHMRLERLSRDSPAAAVPAAITRTVGRLRVRGVHVRLAVAVRMLVKLQRVEVTIGVTKTPVRLVAIWGPLRDTTHLHAPTPGPTQSPWIALPIVGTARVRRMACLLRHNLRLRTLHGGPMRPRPGRLRIGLLEGL